MPEIRALSKSLAKLAADELNEVPERISSNIEAFREWINQSPHLNSRTDDQFLISFLRGCKYSLEKAKQKLDLFYTVRTHAPELIKNRDPLDEHTLGMIRVGFGLPLPITDTPASPRIVLVRPGIFDPKIYTIQDAMRVTTMMLDYMLNEDDNFVIAGQIGILDLSGVTIQHFLQFNPTFIKKMTVLTQDAAPGRQKGLHWVNTPRGFEQVFNVFTGFMNEKNRSRLFVHNDLESLHKHVPKRLLPKEYGGDAGTVESLINEWEKKVMSYRTYYQEEDTLYGVDEKLRAGVKKSSNTIFGVDGTFRKLDID